jgi:hypothetical protein
MGESLPDGAGTGYLVARHASRRLGVARPHSEAFTLWVTQARGCPRHLAGRSLRPSRPPFARCCPRFGILPALGQQRRSIGTGNPSQPYAEKVAAGFWSAESGHPPTRNRRDRVPPLRGTDSSGNPPSAKSLTNTAARRCGRRAEARRARRGQGWPGGAQASASSQRGEGHLGCPSAEPRLRGPWMAAKP